MIPLIPLSLAKPLRLTGTQAVNAKMISKNESPHQRPMHKGAIWSMEVNFHSRRYLLAPVTVESLVLADALKFS
jgi:hypothetical protein